MAAEAVLRGGDVAVERTERDHVLLLGTFGLLATGLVMVLSASQALGYLQHHSALYFFQRQVIWTALGVAAMLVLSRVDYHRLRRPAGAVAAIVAAGMLLVLLPQVGVKVNGARRWFELGPLGLLQPSEVGKLAFAVFAADWLDRRGDRL